MILPRAVPFTRLAALKAAAPCGANLFARAASTTPTQISNPTLRGIETRWVTMSEDEREDIISQLAERQKVAWTELTPLEKKAAWYISYGEWGPRRPVHPKGSVFRITLGVGIGISISIVLFAISRYFAPPLPKTMSEEWQTRSNEILASVNAEPFSGYNQIQSGPTGISAEDEEDEDDD